MIVESGPSQITPGRAYRTRPRSSLRAQQEAPSALIIHDARVRCNYRPLAIYDSERVRVLALRGGIVLADQELFARSRSGTQQRALHVHEGGTATDWRER